MYYGEPIDKGKLLNIPYFQNHGMIIHNANLISINKGIKFGLNSGVGLLKFEI